MSTSRPSLSTLSVRERMDLWKEREKAATNKALSTPESVATSKQNKRTTVIANRMSTSRMSGTVRSSGGNRASFTQRNSMQVMGRASTAMQGTLETISEAFITGEAEYPTLGLKLAYLQEFINQFGGRSALMSYTVRDVQERIIKPELAKNSTGKANGATFCDVVAKRTPDHVEPSNWYVSCSETDNFLQVVDAVTYTLNQNLTEEDNNRACIWLSIFSLPVQDAHIYMQNEQWWSTKMLKAIASVENFLLVVEPLQSSVSLTSPTVWSELLCCYKSNIKFEIAMTMPTSSRFLDDVYRLPGAQSMLRPAVSSRHLFESSQGGIDVIVKAVEKNLATVQLTAAATASCKDSVFKLDYIAKTMIESRLIRLYLDSMDEPSGLTLVMLKEFHEKNSTHPNCNILDTALVCFGGIFQMFFTTPELRYQIAPNSDFSEAKLETLISKEIDNVKMCMTHAVADVRDTAAWTVATLFQYDIFAIPSQQLTEIMDRLKQNLKDPVPSVIAKTCYALHSFVAMLLEGSPATVKILDQHIIPRTEEIWSILDQESASDSLLQYNVCQLLKMIVSKTEVSRQREYVIDMMSKSVLKMHNSFQNSSQPNSTIAVEDLTLQMHMCELIGECVVKLHRSMDYSAGGYLRTIPPAMGVLFQVLEYGKQINRGTDAALVDLIEKAQIEALLTVSDIADVLADDPNSNFHTYFDRLLPIMFTLMADMSKAEVAIITLSTMGDVIRSLKAPILLKYFESIQKAVITSYYASSSRRGLLFSYVNVIADLALQLGAPYAKTITGPNCDVLLVLKDYAALIKTMHSDDAATAYSSLLIAVAGILVDVRELQDRSEVDSKAFLIDIFVQFVEQLVYSNVNLAMCDDLLRDASGVVGDIAQVFGAASKDALDKPFLSLLLSRSKKSILAFATATWSMKLLEEALSIKVDPNQGTFRF